MSDLYETDFYAWTRAQAMALEALAVTRPNAPIDWPHLIEEVADLGKSERDTVRSHVRTILEHLLKLKHSEAVDPRPGWRLTALRTRAALDDKLTPSLHNDVEAQLERLYDLAQRAAAISMGDHGETAAAAALPITCPWSLAEITDPDFWP